MLLFNVLLAVFQPFLPPSRASLASPRQFVSGFEPGRKDGTGFEPVSDALPSVLRSVRRSLVGSPAGSARRFSLGRPSQGFVPCPSAIAAPIRPACLSRSARLLGLRQHPLPYAACMDSVIRIVHARLSCSCPSLPLRSLHEKTRRCASSRGWRVNIASWYVRDVSVFSSVRYLQSTCEHPTRQCLTGYTSYTSSGRIDMSSCESFQLKSFLSVFFKAPGFSRDA